MPLEEDIYRYAVKNAFLHQGKADINAVVAKLIALDAEVKSKMKEVMPKVIQTVKQINSMQFQEIESEYKKFEQSYELKPKEKKAGLPELFWAEKQPVVTRYAPNPNGPFHLGNARAAFLSHEYARMYNGKFILRFEDTDPKIKKSMKNAEELFREDLAWLGITPDEVFFQSDRLEVYYEYISKLILMGKAYVCFCKSEVWRKLIQQKQACPCREKLPEIHLNDFQKMLAHEVKQGEAVIRIKTDLDHPDPSVRDYWLARVIDSPSHPRVGSKYFVWPAYNLAAAVDDHEMGITFILRGQEHAQNEEKQRFMYRYFGWIYPHAVHFGRIKLGKIVLSTSKIKEGIEKGVYIGWDDPRLGTIKAFKRKGFQPEALKQALTDLGINTNDASIDLKKLIDLNKKLIDEKADRVTFISDPVKLDVQFSQDLRVEFSMHPDFPERGKRVYYLKKGSQSFFVSKTDLDKLELGETARLRNAYNIKLTSKNDFNATADFIGAATLKKNILFWLVDPVEVEVMLENAEKIRGLVEKIIEEKREGDLLQFERFGYVRIDSKKDLIKVWFTHT